MKFIIQTLITLYQWTLSPLLGRNCRYEPTCSAYMREAVEKHGAIKGVLLGLRRVGRCHPLAHKHWEATKGYDPVPEVEDKKTEK